MISWNDDLKVGNDTIDADHQSFIELLEKMPAADDATFQTLFADMVQHVKDHFAREEEIMDETGFFATPVHKGEHQRVLAEVADVAAQLEAGQIDEVRSYCSSTLPDWFIMHRNTMDAATAAFARGEMGCGG